MIIAITGHAGSGKDTVADVIAKHTGSHDLYRFAFADPIKEAGSALLNVDANVFRDRHMKDSVYWKINNWTPRDVLKGLGAWTRANFGPIVFASILVDKIKQVSSDAVVLVTDLRMPSEIAALQVEFGDRVVLVHVDADERLGYNHQTVHHDTERHVDSIRDSRLVHKKIMLTNNGSLEEFQQQVEDRISSLV